MLFIKNITIIIFVTCALLGTEAFASAGHVIYSFGNNYVLNNKGNKHEIRKGDEVFSGDTLITSQHGRLQLRFSDKGMVSIMPDSEYKIDDYEFVPGDDNKQKGFFSLLRGGARQITGLLSKIRHERFRFRTTVATIGIRGTGFYVRLCKANCYDGNGKRLPDGMYTKNDTGIITMSNDGGEIELAQGQSAFSANNKDKPRQIYEPPAPYNVAFNDLNRFDFNIGKTLDSGIVQVTGGSTPLPPPLALTRLESSFILPGGSKVEQHNADTGVAGNTITHNSGSITAYNGVVSGVVTAPISAGFDSTGGALQESGSNQALGVIWSRWTGGTVTENGSPVATADNNIHMIGAGSLTPATGIPSSGTLSYTSIAGTLPTFVGPSSTAVGTQSITFDINYQTQELSNMSVTANFAGGAITASQTNGIDIISGSSSVINLTGTCAFALCNQTGGTAMSGNISVNLVGANAQGAFGTYGLSNNFDASVTGSYLATGQ